MWPETQRGGVFCCYFYATISCSSSLWKLFLTLLLASLQAGAQRNISEKETVKEAKFDLFRFKRLYKETLTVSHHALLLYSQSHSAGENQFTPCLCASLSFSGLWPRPEVCEEKLKVLKPDYWPDASEELFHSWREERETLLLALALLHPFEVS